MLEMKFCQLYVAFVVYWLEEFLSFIPRANKRLFTNIEDITVWFSL
jgi:hypothetical protein